MFKIQHQHSIFMVSLHMFTKTECLWYVYNVHQHSMFMVSLHIYTNKVREMTKIGKTMFIM